MFRGESDPIYDGGFPADRPILPFQLIVAIVLLALCIGYAVVFTRMVYISVADEYLNAHVHLPRYAGQPHHHNPVEWLLLVTPALIGWVGTVRLARYVTNGMRRNSREGPAREDAG